MTRKANIRFIHPKARQRNIAQTYSIGYDSIMPMLLHHVSRFRVLNLVALLVLTASLLSGCSPLASRTRIAGAPDAAVYPREALDLPAIQYDELPREARQTLRLIDEGGPFPYDQDGQTFQNREGILPDRPMGYYEEYTVDTPGSDDRGARRIVTGENGERYYTADHYDSFSRVIP